MKPLYLLSGIRIEEVTYIRRRGDRVVVATSTGGQICVNASRLFEKREDAEARVPFNKQHIQSCRGDGEISQSWRRDGIEGDGWARR